MDPDVLLREFLKATADPANRHLAARQFLTQSASNAWDDAGSALLIDHVVFVETRAAERVSVSMRADILGSLSDVGVFETAEGWTTSDVAATDPGVADGAGAGLHALVNGSLVGLDGQHTTSVPGAFGRVGDQTGAALSRSGRQVASVVTLRRGAPDQAASLWIGDLGGEAVQAADGHSLTRPSWSLDDAVWVVVDSNNVLRAIQEPASGQPARIPVDSAVVASSFPGPITDLQLSRDSTRAAMVINGQVILAGVEQTQAG